MSVSVIGAPSVSSANELARIDHLEACLDRANHALKYGLFDKAIDAADRGIALRDRIQNIDLLASLYCIKAQALLEDRYYQQKYPVVVRVANQGIALKDRMGNMNILAQLCVCKSLAFSKNEQYDEAIEAANSGIAFEREITDVDAIANLYACKADALCDVRRSAEALKVAEIAISRFRDRIQDRNILSSLVHSKACSLIAKGRFSEAVDIASDEIDNPSTSRHYRGLFQYLIDLSETKLIERSNQLCPLL